MLKKAGFTYLLLRGTAVEVVFMVLWWFWQLILIASGPFLFIFSHSFVFGYQAVKFTLC